LIISSGVQLSNLVASDHEAILHLINAIQVRGKTEHFVSLSIIATFISEVLIFHQFGQEKLHLTRTCQE